jgi:LEA14-like dessication related protein
MKIPFIVLLSILFAYSCKAPKDLEYRDMHNFKLKQARLKETMVQLDIQLYNPNAYNVKIKKADIDVFFNDSRLGKVKVKGKYTIPKTDTASLPVTLEVDLATALPELLKLAFAKEIKIKLSGTIKAGRRIMFVRLPVHYEGLQDVKAIEGLKGMLKW